MRNGIIKVYFCQRTEDPYDPKLYADEEIQHWGWEAMAEGISAGRIMGRKITGYSNNGVKFFGWISKETGKITNFYPTLK